MDHTSFAQQTCPACDATIDRQAARCPLCGHRFGETPVRRALPAASKVNVPTVPQLNAAAENAPRRAHRYWWTFLVAIGCILVGGILFVGGMAWGMSGSAAGGPLPGSKYGMHCAAMAGVAMFWAGVVWAVLYAFWRIVAFVFHH